MGIFPTQRYLLGTILPENTYTIHMEIFHKHFLLVVIHEMC
jgi:hypothetical protein